MKTAILTLALVGVYMSALATIARADGICETLDQCQELQKKVESRIQTLLRPKLSDAARGEDGKILSMNYEDAKNYCAGRGSRLPSAREFALFAMSLGGRPLIETRHPDLSPEENAIHAEMNAMSFSNYNYVFKMDDGKKPVVDFYASFSGDGSEYRRPNNDLGDHWYWSESQHPYMSHTVYSLDARNGRIQPADKKMPHGAARCIEIVP